jgi:SAM-dependent methyltransferase
MKDFWNERYSNKAFAYGKEPNRFFKEMLDSLNLSGKVLLPAEGEGRNAVYAAKKGLDVLAFDISNEGKKKAELLAKQENVSINYKVNTLTELNLKPNSFDVIALIFAHFPADLKSEIHQQLSVLLKPNGILILEGFSKKHLEFQEKNNNAGGPKNIKMLFSEEEIKNDFKDLEIISLEETTTVLKEGDFHNGFSSVIRFVGMKK